MARNDLPRDVLRLLWRHLDSVDHVAVLLSLRAAHQSPDVTAGTSAEAGGPGGALHEGHDIDALSAWLSSLCGVPDVVVDVILPDLEAAGILARSGTRLRYAPSDELRVTIEQLADAYNTRPVTLVRAIYDRPDAALRSFADAFRIRPPEEP